MSFAQSLAKSTKAVATVPHIELQALAGTGKTSSCIEGLKSIKGIKPGFTPSPQQKEFWRYLGIGKSDSVRLSAFNTTITDEMKEKVIASGLDRLGVEARGIHSLGLQAVTKRFGRVQANKWQGLDQVCDTIGRDWNILKKEKGMFSLVNVAADLVSYCKQGMIEPNIDNLDALVSHFDLDMDGVDKASCFNLVPQVLETAKNPKGKISFDDMIWLPLVHNLPIPKVDIQIVDECLPGWTPVMLADGRSMSIKEIVESDSEIRVKSYNCESGKEQNCLVIGRQKILNQKPLVKVKVKHLHKTNGNRKSNFVVCTTDHKVWTVNRGWVEAGQINVGDNCIIETSAKTTQKGKITKRGRECLAKLQEGNKRGLGNKGGDPVLFSKSRGGNGKGPTLAESTLLDTLNSLWDGWLYNYIVTTRESSKSGLGNRPTHYKLDIANPAAMICIEVDGSSHTYRKDEDKSKTEFLENKGWTVLRVSNKEAIQQTLLVIEKLCEKIMSAGSEVCTDDNCPRPAKVISVDPITIPDSYVYDITVEVCHNFYANGILVHNCQDLNRMQQELMYKAGHRIIFVGDRRQAIYGFAGADSISMQRMADTLATTPSGLVQLPLTVTRRCGKAIVQRANEIVPEYEAHEDNPEGIVREAKYPTQKKNGRTTELDWKDSYCSQVEDGAMILCRVNAPLVSQCFRFLKRDIPANILGRNIGQGLISLVQKSKTETIDRLQEWLEDWLQNEIEKEHKKKFCSEERLIALQDRVDCINCFCDGVKHTEDVVNKINQIFTDDKNRKGIKLASIHRSKGLEAQQVFILMPKGAECPHPLAKTAWQRDQEINLLYVAITRAINELVFVY